MPKVVRNLWSRSTGRVGKGGKTSLLSSQALRNVVAMYLEFEIGAAPVCCPRIGWPAVARSAVSEMVG